MQSKPSLMKKPMKSQEGIEPKLVVIETFKRHGYEYLVYQCQRCGRKYTAVKAIKISVCHCLHEGMVRKK